MSFIRPSAWLPDRTPTWTDVTMTALGLALLGLNLVTSTAIAWPVVAVGAVLSIGAMGPFSTTRTADRLEAWAEARGGRGRLLVVGLFVAGTLLAVWPADTPATLLTSFAAGIFAGTAVFVAIHVWAAGEIDGWQPT